MAPKSQEAPPGTCPAGDGPNRIEDRKLLHYFASFYLCAIVEDYFKSMSILNLKETLLIFLQSILI